MKNVVFVQIFLFFMVSCQNGNKSDSLNLIWETPGFYTPESVCFDESANILYVSNIAGKNPLEKDGNGFISRLSPDGSIIDLMWATGLNAPKGMTLSGGFLYVTDIDRVVKIDISEGRIVGEIDIIGAAFLNDIVSLENEDLIISDSKNGSYYRINNEQYEVFLSDSSFISPNGITLENNVILTGVGDKIIKIYPETGKMQDYILETGKVDGIERVAEDLFIISDWKGMVHLVSPKHEKVLILNTTETEGVNTADFCYDSRNGRLYIPTFFNNTIACYQLTNHKLKSIHEF